MWFHLKDTKFSLLMVLCNTEMCKRNKVNILFGIIKELSATVYTGMYNIF